MHEINGVYFGKVLLRATRQLAKKRKVSVSRLVREALENYYGLPNPINPLNFTGQYSAAAETDKKIDTILRKITR